MQALVVDDSRAMRGMIRRVLEGFGITVQEAADGQQALLLLNAGYRPDIAMVDWNMPNMNGYDLICNLRRNREFDSLRIVMVTTEVETDQMSKALDAGACEYVMKPFSAQGLIEKLELLGIAREAA